MSKKKKKNTILLFNFFSVKNDRFHSKKVHERTGPKSYKEKCFIIIFWHFSIVDPPYFLRHLFTL